MDGKKVTMDPLYAAKELAALVEKEAWRLGVPVTFCALDVHGNVVLKQLMTGAKLISIEMSERKAYTAAALDMKTADMTPMAVPDKALDTLASAAGGRYTVLGGGLPLHVDGAFLGGVGVSGGTTEQDIEIVEKAVELFFRTSRPPQDTDAHLPTVPQRFFVSLRSGQRGTRASGGKRPLVERQERVG